jgi:kumamolisin
MIPGSVRVPDAGGRAIGGARINRTVLTAQELATPMRISVTLPMRDFAGLEARLATGEQVPAAEMEARYLPLRSDYARVAGWLLGQGLTPTLRDRTHTTVFVAGRSSDVSRAFGVALARVAVGDGEYTSAVSEPTMPVELAPLVLSVNGLQPEFRLRHLEPAAEPHPDDVLGESVYVTPDNLASAYAIPPSATGAGQIVAIVAQAPAIIADLPLFWDATGIPQSPGNVVNIDVDGGAGANPPADGTIEANIDAQWTSAMAPGVGIRMYVAADAFECIAQILNDLPEFPSMSVLSISFGYTEGTEGAAVLQASSQQYASLAAAGVSVMAATGDCGSNTANGTGAGNYSATAPLAVAYPASDPNVTAVGGTTLTFAGNWASSSEVVWNQITSTDAATGGGVSSFFAKPSWQTGNAVLAGQTMRCIPDVASFANADLVSVNAGPGNAPLTGDNLGVLAYINATPLTFGGTSVACPIWSAIVALVNQGRAAAGAGPIGLLGPHIYPLSGTSAFHDITSGSNGAYSAGPGYDLCSGIGSPNVANLIPALGGTTVFSHRLVNVSVRAQVGTGSNIVIAGFVVAGAAGTTKDVLVRAVGPGLASLGVAGTLASPVVGVFDSAGALVASDAGWGSVPQAGPSLSGATFRQATAADMAITGAFALAPGSADSAMVLTLPTGSYTVEVSGAAASGGVALSEVYEMSTTVPQSLKNISARCSVGAGSQVAICGFVVEGNEPAELLVRGIGPALGSFGLTGTLAEPSISIFDSGNTLVASDTGWGNPRVAGTSAVAATSRQATTADMASVGAFAIPAGSADSAIVVTLPPGSYTAVVSGVNSTGGTALAEVYELTGN